MAIIEQPLQSDSGLETSGNIVAGNVLTDNYLYANGQSAVYTDSNVSTYLSGGTDTANIITTGNVSGAYVLGNGSALTSLTGSAVTGFVANATLASTSNVAYAVDGANVNGFVANATLASTSNVAYSVAGANVSGFVANATLASTANVAYSVSGANVSGFVANATLASTANVASVAYSVDLANVAGAGNIASINLNGSNTQVLLGNGTWATPAAGYSNADVSTYLASGNNTAGYTTTGNISAAEGTLSGNLSVAGNLTVAGNLNYQQVTNLEVGDPLIYIGANNTANVVDLGMIVSWDNGVYQHGGWVRDASDGTWKLFGNVVDEPTTTVDFANAIYQPMLAGSVSTTGNITAAGVISATGNVTGSYFIGNGSQLTGLTTTTSWASITDKNNASGPTAIALGQNSGATSQGVQAIAFGLRAGQANQGPNGVAIGVNAGNSAQGSTAIAIGQNSGSATQGIGAVAVGPDTGSTSQGISAVAVGSGAGITSQGNSAVAIGQNAGSQNQGANSVAIGFNAGYGNQTAGSIAINASGANLNPTTAGFYVNPVRNDTGNVTNVVYYNTTTKEVTYGPAGGGGTYGDANVSAYLASGNNTAGYSTTGNVTANSAVIGNGRLYSVNNFLSLATGLEVSATFGGTIINVSDTAGVGQVAIGAGTGAGTQTVAIGDHAGVLNPGAQSVSIGTNAGNFGPGAKAVAIGQWAGAGSFAGTKLGANAVVIGAGAAAGGSATNVIVLNATGANFTPSTSQASSFYVNPIRNDTGNVTNVVYYNTTTKEVTYGPGAASYGDANVSSYLAGGTNTAGISTTGNVTANNLIATNTITISGNVGTGNISGANNISGINLIASNTIVAGATITQLPNSIATFGANVDSYAQINFQNKSSGTNAEADFVVTADNGSDSVNYINMGIVNSAYDNTTPTNSLGNIIYAADSYLYAQGNNAATTQSGGNLAIGTTTVGKNVKIFAGGGNTGNLVATFGNTGIVAPGNISGNYILGNGAFLTGISGGGGSSTSISNGTSNVSIPTSGGNITMAAGGIPAFNLSPVDNSIAIGASTRTTSPGSRAIAIGQMAGQSLQGSYAVAIGYMAGNNNQSGESVAVGPSAGQSAQGLQSTAVGAYAGWLAQGASAVAVGCQAGNSSQGGSAIAIGRYAGFVNQGTSAIAIGYNAGNSSQGANSIAIGTNTGVTSQAAGSIILNASGATQNGTNAGFYVNPVRNDTGNTTNVVYFNTSTKELTYGPASGGSGNVTVDSFATSTVTSGSVNAYDCTSTQIFYVDASAATNNWGINLTNLSLASGKVTNVTFIIVSGSTYNAYTDFQIGGTSQTVTWSNGIAPNFQNAQKMALTYSILNNGGTYIILASGTAYY